MHLEFSGKRTSEQEKSPSGNCRMGSFCWPRPTRDLEGIAQAHLQLSLTTLRCDFAEG